MSNILWQMSAILLVYNGGMVRGDIYQECAHPEKFNTFVASQSSCARYIFCDGDNSFEGECLDDNYFNEQEGNCDAREAVVCPIGAGAGEETNAISGGETHAEGGRNEGATSQESQDDNDDEAHNQNSSMQPSGGNSEHELPLANEPTPLPQCPIMFGLNSLQHLPNPDSCFAYYTCYNGIAIPMLCASQMYFNADTGRCTLQEGVRCPFNRPVRLNCRKGIYDFIPHPRNCEYYYFCSNGFLMIFHCPVQFSWHYERRMCVHQSQAKCYPNSMLQEMLFG